MKKFLLEVLGWILGMGFWLLIFWILASNEETPLVKQKVSYCDRHELFMQSIGNWDDKPIKKLKLITFIEDNSIPTKTDYGTFEEIDSIKCIRYREMKISNYKLKKINKKTCK